VLTAVSMFLSVTGAIKQKRPLQAAARGAALAL
jgi:hypothetical protein